MRAALGVLLVACGAPVEAVEMSEPEGRDESVEALGETEAPEEHRGEAEPEESVDWASGVPSLGQWRADDPCYLVEAAVLERWPEASIDLEVALGRWLRWYRPGETGEECAIRVRAIDASSGVTRDGRCSWACSFGPEGLVALRTDVTQIVGSDGCSAREWLLVDILTHEVGHLFLGPEHTATGALRERTEACTSVLPADAEIATANRCGAGGPPHGAECPE